MLRLKRTNSQDPDFVSLVEMLDKDLAVSDGDEHDFYHQYNGIDLIKHTIVVYDGNRPVAIGAIKKYNDNTVEIKRMYTLPQARGKGLATKVLDELEAWAKELGNTRCILETGKKQPYAIALYHKTGYTIIPNYDQYVGIDNSVCFEKLL